jgi:hypothetical protein
VQIVRKYSTHKRAARVAQVVELLSKQETLSSKSSTAKKKKKKNYVLSFVKKY